MSTSTSQRIGIWIIAVVLGIGTIGSFFVVIVANDNAKVDSAKQEDLQRKFNALQAEYTAKVDAQNKELSDKYYETFKQYAGEVAPYNKDDVTEVTSRDFVVGDGEEISDKTSYSAYYIGWNPEGVIFDQSIDGDKLKSPIPGSGLIQGWTDGVKGMKIGGIRELTIPADKAYGDKGNGDLIPPHSPIKFIVMAIPTPPAVPTPNYDSILPKN